MVNATKIPIQNNLSEKFSVFKFKPFRKEKTKSAYSKSEIKIKITSTNKSIILSVITVPINEVTEIFSFFDRTAHLVISPALGINKLVK